MTTTDSEFRLLLDKIIMDKYEQLTSNTTTSTNETSSPPTQTSPPTIVVDDVQTEGQEESTDSEELRKAKEWLYQQGVKDTQEYMEKELIKKHQNFLKKSAEYDNKVQKESKKNVLKLGK